MDLVEIASRTGISARQLRYAIYHTLIPGVKPVDVGKGVVRRFTEFEAFGIAVAATLLEAGLRRHAAAECLELLAVRYSRGTPLSDVPLWCAFQGRGPAYLEIGDLRFVRVRRGAGLGNKASDPDWAGVEGAVPTGYQPGVLLSINVAPLRDALRGKRRT